MTGTISVLIYGLYADNIFMLLFFFLVPLQLLFLLLICSSIFGIGARWRILLTTLEVVDEFFLFFFWGGTSPWQKRPFDFGAYLCHDRDTGIFQRDFYRCARYGHLWAFCEISSCRGGRLRPPSVSSILDVDVDVDVVDLRAQADASMPASNNNVNYAIYSNF